MPFFSNLADRIQGYTLKLTISREGDKLHVMVLPEVSKKEEIQKEIVPLAITGTPTDLDQNFFASFGQVLDKTKELANTIALYEKGLEKAKKKTEPANKAGTKKEPEKKEPEKKEDKSQSSMNFEENKEETRPAEEKVPDNVDEDTGEIKEESTDSKEEPKKRERVEPDSGQEEKESNSGQEEGTSTDPVAEDADQGTPAEDDETTDDDW